MGCIPRTFKAGRTITCSGASTWQSAKTSLPCGTSSGSGGELGPGALLSAVARRLWVVTQRLLLGQHARCSIDCFVTAIYWNERRLCCYLYGKASLVSRPCGSDWVFPDSEPHNVPWYTARTGKSLKGLARALWANEDSCVPV